MQLQIYCSDGVYHSLPCYQLIRQLSIIEGMEYKFDGKRALVTGAGKGIMGNDTCTLKKLIHSVLTEPTLFATICTCRRDGSMILREGVQIY